jgi:hypothetical protein
MPTGPPRGIRDDYLERSLEDSKRTRIPGTIRNWKEERRKKLKVIKSLGERMSETVTSCPSPPKWR